MEQQHYLVTGGGGFVGLAICKALRARGARVTSLSRGSYPTLERIGVRAVKADLSAPNHTFNEAFENVDGVFHVAAKVDMWGNYDDFYRSNFLGTQNVVNACIANRVPRLVFTSSPSVVAREYDLSGVDESLSYPQRYLADYPKTKALAEQFVLSVDQEVLSTVSLRPHLIWGPGDNNFVPTILAKARAGKLFGVGAGKNLVDFSYIDDCVAAHLLAMERLGDSPAVRGKAFFVSQDEPYPLWNWIDEVLVAHQLPKIARRIPYRIARTLGGVCEFFCRLYPGNCEPRVTRFLVDQMAHEHFFDISAAKSLLGYRPEFSMKDAFVATFKAPATTELPDNQAVAS
ncbi:MAG: NAD-dependent epimerase/dehydratase family protein [Bdellovibrionales bacterium]|nr:NAD-dependent epimerase/dehydratase family protein [Bdellovibrionales bacterium]